MQSLEKLAEELLSSLLIASSLHQNIKRIPIPINRSPQVMGMSIIERMILEGAGSEDKLKALDEINNLSC